MIEKAYDNLIHILRKFTNNTNRTNEDDIKKMNRILDLLDEDDDVQNVYHNWDE